MNFLEIAQKVARDSGTFASKSVPTAIDGQDQRSTLVIDYVAEAWLNIQNERAGWLWMESEFEAQTIANEPRYTAASWDIERWADWVIDSQDHDSASVVSIYKLSDGKEQEGALPYLPYRDWRVMFDRGVVDPTEPTFYTVSPAGEFCLGATPDDVYVVRGLYRKSPQRLVAATDVPELPERYHEGIAWRAQIALNQYDEARFMVGSAVNSWSQIQANLMRDQLPHFTLGTSSPLA